MKIKTLLLTLSVCFAGGAICFAADPQIGTWKLNEAKSELDPNGPKNHTVVYAAAGEQIKVTADGTNPEGKPTHVEWKGNFDGKDYPVMGDSNADMRSYKKVDDRTLETTGKKDGKVVVSGRIVVSTDGKSRTVTLSGTNAKGKKFKIKAVYDKE